MIDFVNYEREKWWKEGDKVVNGGFSKLWLNSGTCMLNNGEKRRRDGEKLRLRFMKMRENESENLRLFVFKLIKLFLI